MYRQIWSKQATKKIVLPSHSNKHNQHWLMSSMKNSSSSTTTRNTHDNFYYPSLDYNNKPISPPVSQHQSSSPPPPTTTNATSSSSANATTSSSTSNNANNTPTSGTTAATSTAATPTFATATASSASINQIFQKKCKVSVLGIGGAGCNAIDAMVRANLSLPNPTTTTTTTTPIADNTKPINHNNNNSANIQLFAVNTDAQALKNTICHQRIQIGAQTTNGLGAGSLPHIGRQSAQESLSVVMDHVKDSSILFLAAGLGGGTGTGAAPIIGAEARKLGILTVGIMTTPFMFEGTRRQRIALEGLREMRQCVDTLIIVPNENVLSVATRATTVSEAFKVADDVLVSGVRSITDLLLKPGLINLDFADVQTIMKDGGMAFMGTGYGYRSDMAPHGAHHGHASSSGNVGGVGSGGISRDMLLSQAMSSNQHQHQHQHHHHMPHMSRGRAAVSAALQNPLLGIKSTSQARNVLLSIVGGPDLTLHEVQEISNEIKDHVHPDANIIIGASNDHDDLDGAIKVSVILTGIPETEDGAPVSKAKVEPATVTAASILPPPTATTATTNQDQTTSTSTCSNSSNNSSSSNEESVAKKSAKAAQQKEEDIGFIRRLFRNHW